jgi:hypothetical protein
MWHMTDVSLADSGGSAQQQGGVQVNYRGPYKCRVCEAYHTEAVLRVDLKQSDFFLGVQWLDDTV